MRKIKKICLGVGLAALLAVIFIFQNRALAAVPPVQTSGTKNIQTYYDSCVDRILVKNGGGTWCQWFNDKVPDSTMLYGQANAYSVSALTVANYQYSKDNSSVQGISVPARITILNSKNTALGSLGDSNLGPDATAVYTARLSKESYLVYAPGSGGDNRYVLLVAPQKNNQPPFILALVKKDVIYKDTSSVPNGDGVVYAYKINKESVATKADGSAQVPTVLKGSVCTDGSDCVNGLCQKDNGDCTNNTASTVHSCESNFVSPFAWVVCPALDLADSIIQSVYGQVEGQLCFNTGKTSSTGGVVCQGQPNSLVDGVKGSWNIFKNIASALLVIALLIMIISQAMGGGLFEAYTIRKMLPKLVIAVILMQLSFVLLKYAIDLSNDAGTAIGNIILAPFGGVDHMNLKDMVGNGVHIATGSSPGQAAFDVFATIAAIGGAVWAIPALPLLALYVITGVFIAFFVLIIRKVLIIMLVILAPLAFIAWVMPGMDRYWKMWRENLTKLLVMFPLIMAMLSAGRIVAFITSQAGNGASMFVPHLGIAHLGPVPVPYMASATGFADLVIIIGAYFAPYFLLPKTYSWGGQLLGQAGKAVENLTSKGSEAPKKFLKSREEGYRAERRRKSQERVAAGQDNFRTLNPIKWGSTTVDKLRSGKWDPTLGRPKFIAGGSRRRQASIDSYVQSGEETYQKDIEAARTRVLREGQNIRARGGNWDRYFQMVADGVESYEDDKLGLIKIGKRSEAERDAARKQTAILGSATNWRYLEEYYQRANASSEEEEEMRSSGRGHLIMSAQEKVRARKFFDDNVQTIMPKMPHFYQGYAAAADATGSALAGQHGVEVESILAHFSKKIEDATKAGDADELDKAQRSLLTYLQNFNEAASNPNIHLDNGAIRAVKGFLDSTGGAEFRKEINTRAIDGRAVREIPTVESYDTLSGLSPDVKSEIDRIKDSLAPRIDSVTGTLSPAAEGLGTAGGAADAAKRIPESRLDTPDTSGWTPRDDALAENAARDEYHAYMTRITRTAVDPRSYPPLSPEEQRRFEQIRAAHPDWQ
jgi:hypothetical protein